MSDHATRTTEIGLGREDVEDVGLAVLEARLRWYETKLNWYRMRINLFADAVAALDFVETQALYEPTLDQLKGFPMQEERSYGANIGVLDAKVAKKEPGVLEQIQNEQHITREIVASLYARLSQAIVIPPTKEQGDTAEPANDLFLALQNQRDINARLRTLVSSIIL